MTRLGKLYTFAAAFALVSIMVGAVSANRTAEEPARTVLGIEIPMKNGPFTVPAAGPRTNVYAHIPVPSVDSAKALPGQVTAVRLMPRLVEDKVQVQVFALYGNISNVKSCEEWKGLKSSYVGEYTVGNGEEFAVKELASLGANFAGQPLTVRVVPLKVAAAAVQVEPIEVTACQCAGCGGLSCCPDNGKCMRCGDCGSACCEIKET